MTELLYPLAIHLNREDLQYSNRFAHLEEPAINHANNLVEYFCNKDIETWDCVSRILKVPPVTPQRKEDFRHSFEAATVHSSQKKYNVYTSVQSADGETNISFKWGFRDIKPVMARFGDISFLFLHHNPFIRTDLQFDQLMEDYLYFNEPVRTSNHHVKRVDNKNRLSQMVFSWDYQPQFSLFKERAQVTFYKYEPMDLPNASWAGGTFITTNTSL